MSMSQYSSHRESSGRFCRIANDCSSCFPSHGFRHALRHDRQQIRLVFGKKFKLVRVDGSFLLSHLDGKVISSMA